MSQSSTEGAAKRIDSPAPWWSFGHVWLVLAGPAVVVVAGLTTLYIAVKTADTLVDENSYRQQKGVETSQGGASAPDASLAPAMQARNHAQTGVQAGSPSAEDHHKP